MMFLRLTAAVFLLASRSAVATPSPSTSPTTSPTANPTGSPTASPSGSPTVSPTKNPTGSPTVSPTKNPSTSPTSSPTGSPTVAPTLEVQFPATLTIDAADGDQTPLSTTELTAIQTAIEAVACPAGVTDEIDCSVAPIVSQNVTFSSARRLRNPLSRQLATGSLIVDFKVIVEMVCAYSQCDNSATGVQARADAAYAEVKANLNAAAFQSIVDALKSTVGAVSSTSTGTAVWDAVVVPLLETLSKYFPDWTGGSGTCLNDNTMPLYMRITGSYLEETLKACCERFYGWDITTCMGADNYDLTGFYPSWENTDVKCLDASTDEPPLYMQNNPTAWLIDDVEDCCERYYNWDLDTCLVDSGAVSAASLYSGEWYVDYENDKCVRDCAVATTDPTCGGKNKPWETLYDSPADCCEGTLWWNEAATCEAASTGGTAAAATGSGDWYVDWENSQCVKDCPKSTTDTQCGGLRKPWDVLYSSSGTCCDTRLSWKESDECTP